MAPTLSVLLLACKKGWHKICLGPFLALLGIFVFNIIGSISIILDENLFTDRYYYTMLIVSMVCSLYVLFLCLDKKMYAGFAETMGDDKHTAFIFISFQWIIAVVIFFHYVKQHGLPPIFELDLHGNMDIYAIRGEKTTNVEGGIHWYRLAFGIIPPIVFIYSYLLRLIYTESRYYRLLFYVNTCLCVFFMSCTLGKSQILYLLLYVWIAQSMINNNNLSLRKAFLYIVCGAGSVAIMLRIYLMDRSYIAVLYFLPTYIYNRIFVTYTKAHAYLVQMIPYTRDYFYGATFGNPGGLLPYEPVNLSQQLGWWADGTFGNYSMPCFSEGYANYGYIGIAFVLAIMFFQIFIIQKLGRWMPKKVLFLALFILCSVKMLRYAIEPIQSVLEIIFLMYLVVSIISHFVISNVIKVLFGSSHRRCVSKDLYVRGDVGNG